MPIMVLPFDACRLDVRALNGKRASGEIGMGDDMTGDVGIG